MIRRLKPLNEIYNLNEGDLVRIVVEEYEGKPPISYPAYISYKDGRSVYFSSDSKRESTYAVDTHNGGFFVKNAVRFCIQGKALGYRVLERAERGEK